MGIIFKKEDMSKHRLHFLFLIVLCVVTQLVAAQKKAEVKTISVDKPLVKKERYEVAVLTPMYLDSFDLNENLLNLPPYAAPGIEFYQGVQLAADTLNNMGIKLNVHIYDTKSKYLDLGKLITTHKFDSVDCIIGNIGGTEIKQLASFCKTRDIPLISAVSPSDGEQVGNPNFILLQPRLYTHMERLRKAVQTKYGDANIMFANRTTANNETNAWTYYSNDISVSNANTKHLSMKQNVLTDGDMQSFLKNDVENIIVLAILEPNTALENLAVINRYKNEGYDIKVFGMPTWANIKNLITADEIQGLDVFITTPYMLDKNTDKQKYVSDKYRNIMGTSTPDIAYKGFDALYYFANLLYKNGAPINKSLRKENDWFSTPYLIGPVIEKEVFKYYENKFLYLAHFTAGTLIYE
jgi:ABC-type branched-subunit amino acid transport system substrate-binding protein